VVAAKNSRFDKLMGDSQVFRGANPEFLATAESGGILFLRYPLSKKVMTFLGRRKHRGKGPQPCEHFWTLLTFYISTRLLIKVIQEFSEPRRVEQNDIDKK
jgi:hypothetical protein